jgi:hypothetical protein
VQRQFVPTPFLAAHETVRHDRPRPLTVAQQLVNLRSNPICSGNGMLQAARLVWRYGASPTPLSRTYQLRIDYRQHDVPQVFVEKPDLGNR